MKGRVLVTGGGTGLGLGIAEALRDAGCVVVLVGRREDVLREAAARIGAEAIVADVTQSPHDVIARAAPLDYLVNNAGSYVHRLASEWTAEDFEAMHRVHVIAPALLARAFAAQASSGASIVNVASTLAARPAPGTGPYSAAKAGMVALTQVLALELAPRGIRANAVLPGVVPTDMTTQPRGGASAAEYLNDMTRRHPLGRLGTARDVADAVCWLLEATWVTGAAIPVDGGLSLSWGPDAAG